MLFRSEAQGVPVAVEVHVAGIQVAQEDLVVPEAMVAPGVAVQPAPVQTWPKKAGEPQ